jgi:hypothetical protein
LGYFSPPKNFLSSRKYDSGCSSRIPDLDFLSIPDPEFRGQKGTGFGSATLVPAKTSGFGILLLLTSSDVQVVKCSACVVRDWGKETPAHDVLQVPVFFLFEK